MSTVIGASGGPTPPFSGDTPFSLGEPNNVPPAVAIWGILWRRRILVLCTTLLFVTAALTYAMLTSPLYTASSQIIVDPRGRQVLVNAINPSGLAPDGGITQVESQVQVIQSNSVLLRAIAETNLTNDPEFNGTRTVFWSAWLSRLGETLHRPSVQSETSTLVKTLQGLRKRLVVRRAEKVFVIDILVTANSPEKAARIANAIANAYLAGEADANAQAAARASSELRARLAEQRERVQAAANAVQNYKATHNIISANGQLVGEQKLATISAELTAVQGSVASLQGKLDALNRLRKSGIGEGATAEALGSPVIAKLRELGASLQERVGDLEARFGPQSPPIAGIRRQLADVNELLRAELSRIGATIQAEYDREVTHQQLLAALLNNAKNEALRVDEASVGLHELERELDADRTVYSAFMARAQELGEQAGIDTSNARVITHAMPPTDKSWPALRLLLAGAIGMGVTLGSAFAMIREYLKPTVFSRWEIEAVAGARVIGVVPQAALAAGSAKFRDAGRALWTNDFSRVSSAALTLRQLSYTDTAETGARRARSLLVTSSPQDSEHRSDMCRLLASAAQSMGDRVLLVDANFANGQAGTRDGLQEILQGQRTLASVIEPLQSDRVVPLGQGRRRTTGISQRDDWTGASRLMSQARENQFDLVIVDGGSLAENLLVAPLLAAVDRVILLVQLGLTSRGEATRAAETAQLMGRGVSGIVLIDPAASNIGT